MGRRSSLLASMDQDGNIDPMKYLAHAKLKRQNYLNNMSNLFPNSAGIIPATNRNSSVMMSRMMLSSMMNGSSIGGTSTGMGGGVGFGNAIGMGGGGGSFRNNNAMDFTRSGVVPPRMLSMMNHMSDAELERLVMQERHNSLGLGNASNINRVVSASTSPSLKPTPEMMAERAAMMAAATSTLSKSQNQQGQAAPVLRKEEYEAAEALLFSMGRACPTNKNATTGAAENRNDEETTVDAASVSATKGKGKKKATPKKAGTPKKRKAKSSTTPKKKTAKKNKGVASGDDEARSMPPHKKRGAKKDLLSLYPECFS
ncbi:MAG: hypothetical protein SGARI_004827 [Bacillariaceae sp.]